jgi:thiamine-phosphate pyrophosphorylase
MMFPPFYPIVDTDTLCRRGVGLRAFVVELRDAGVKLLQYRDKTGAPQEVLRAAAEIAAVFEGSGTMLILNDRADLAVLAGWSGVHVGQEDLSPADARLVAGPQDIVGVSTHSDDQVILANASDADYIAVGPIFATTSKLDTSPVVGLEGVRRARALTQKRIVAIGGITRENARSVIDAGADSVAVIGGLFSAHESVEKVARDFLGILR